MDPDLALSTFWRFAIDDGTRLPYIPAGLLHAAVHELHLFVSADRIRTVCMSPRLPHRNEVTFDLFMELYRQLWKESATTRSRVSPDSMMEAAIPAGTTWVSRADLLTMLAASSTKLSDAENEAILDMLDPDRTGVVEVRRLAYIVNAHNPRSPDPNASSRLPLRTSSASPSPARDPPRPGPSRSSRQRASGSAAHTHHASRRRTRRSGRWVDQDVAAAHGVRTNAQAASLTARAQEGDDDSPLEHGRVRRSRRGPRHSGTEVHPQRHNHQRHQCSRDGSAASSEDVTILVEPCSTVVPERTPVRDLPSAEAHDPFATSQPSSSTRTAPDIPGSVRSPRQDDNRTVEKDVSKPRQHLRARFRQKSTDACGCCVLC